MPSPDMPATPGNAHEYILQALDYLQPDIMDLPVPVVDGAFQRGAPKGTGILELLRVRVSRPHLTIARQDGELLQIHNIEEGQGRSLVFRQPVVALAMRQGEGSGIWIPVDSDGLIIDDTLGLQKFMSLVEAKTSAKQVRRLLAAKN
jgi:hypothetical protein